MINNHLKITWNKVLIVWNWGYKNLWDELILLGTVKLLLEQKKEIYISTHNPTRLKQFFSQFIDVQKVTFLQELPHGFRSFFKFLFSKSLFQFHKYFQVDSVVLWWWEIITEENPKSYIYRLISIRPILLKKLFKKTNLYLMWWVQIPKKSSNKRLFNFMLKRVEFSYLRDFECVDNLKEYWFRNVDFFMDTSYFAYNRDEYRKNYDEWLLAFLKTGKHLPKTPKSIALNLNKNWEKFFDDMKKQILKYQKQWYSFKYIPIAKWDNTYYQDIQYYEKLKKEIPNLQITVLDWEENFSEFILQLLECEQVICTRLHLFLISNFIRLKIHVFPYQKKITKMQTVLKKFRS